MIFVNSTINPFVYLIRSTDFKKAFWELLALIKTGCNGDQDTYIHGNMQDTNIQGNIQDTDIQGNIQETDIHNNMQDTDMQDMPVVTVHVVPEQTSTGE